MAYYRVYTYTPPSQVPAGGNQYNTGRFDSAAPAGQGCLNPDPQGFNDFSAMIAYAASHGETLYGPMSIDQINAVCGGTFSLGGSPTTSIGPAPQTPTSSNAPVTVVNPGVSQGPTNPCCGGAATNFTPPNLGTGQAPEQPAPAQSGISIPAPSVNAANPTVPTSGPTGAFGFGPTTDVSPISPAGLLPVPKGILDRVPGGFSKYLQGPWAVVALIVIVLIVLSAFGGRTEGGAISFSGIPGE